MHAASSSCGKKERQRDGIKVTQGICANANMEPPAVRTASATSMIEIADRLCAATRPEALDGISNTEILHRQFRKLQFDTELMIEGVMNKTEFGNNDEQSMEVNNQSEYAPKRPPFKARPTPEFVLFEQWELEERKVRKAELERRLRAIEKAKQNLSANNNDGRTNSPRPKHEEKWKKKKVVRPRMVQMCADAKDPWERMAAREKRRKKRLLSKKIRQSRADRIKTEDEAALPVEKIEREIMDDLDRVNSEGVPSSPPILFVSAVQKFVQQAKQNDELNCKVDELFRGSLGKTVEFDEFFCLLVELQVVLTAAELLACYEYLNLDSSEQILEAHGDEERGQTIQPVKNKMKDQRSLMARHLEHSLHEVKVDHSRCKTDRSNIFKLNEMEREIQRLDQNNIHARKHFHKIMENVKESFYYSPRYGNDIRTFLKQFDSNGTGFISKENFAIAMNALNTDLREDEIDACVDFLDTNHTGNIDSNEFVYIFHHRRGLYKNVRSKDPELVTAHPLSPEGNKKGTHKHKQEMKQGLLRHRDQLSSIYLDAA